MQIWRCEISIDIIACTEGPELSLRKLTETIQQLRGTMEVMATIRKKKMLAEYEIGDLTEY